MIDIANTIDVLADHVSNDTTGYAATSNPRGAITHNEARIEVDLDRLDLEHISLVKPPEWQPEQAIKLWADIEPQIAYFDIETTGLDPSTSAVLAVGILRGGEYRLITDDDEAALLRAAIPLLSSGIICGHNVFGFDLPFLMARCRKHKVKHPFKTASKTSRISASSMHGKPIEYTPIFARGVDVVDTLHQVAIYDKAAAKLSGYGLKNSVFELGLRDDRGLELSATEIRESWSRDRLRRVVDHRKRVSEYLMFDLEDTRLLANYLLPVVWAQQAYVPDLDFQTLAVASPALKAQKIHQALGLAKAVADEQKSYQGGGITCHAPGLHRNLAKIDVSSLYPSLMLRYGLCSRKDPQHKFLGVLAYMVAERLRLKTLAKAGDTAADRQQGALKILINGSYGYFGTGGYSYNDYECAALVTAYGHKVLETIERVIVEQGGVLVESDTDGVMFTAVDAEAVAAAVQAAMPTGIAINLEFSGWCGYVPKAKNYVLFSPARKAHVKGLYRKRDRCQLEREFAIEFLRLWFFDGEAVAIAYYDRLVKELEAGAYPVDQLSITRRIRENEKALDHLGNSGDTVTYWIGCDRTGKRPQPIKTNTLSNWPDHYVGILKDLVEAAGVSVGSQQVALFAGVKWS